MSNKIYKFNNDLNGIDSVELFVSNAQSMIISQVSDNFFAYNLSIPFTIETAASHVPTFNEEEIMLVLREKIDLSAYGKNENAIKNENKNNIRPYKPTALPIGFVELKGENE